MTLLPAPSVSRWNLPIIALLPAAVVLAAIGCAAPPAGTTTQPTAAAAEPLQPVNDRQVRRTLSARMSELREKNLTADAAELKQQLQTRTSTSHTPAPVSAAPRTSQEIYELGIRSTVVFGSYYKCGKCDRWHDGMASGFAVGPDRVATNYHVLDKQMAGGFAVMTIAGDVYPVVEVLAASEADDAAIVRIDIPDGQPPLTPLPLARDTPVGSSVAVISHPSSRFFTFTQGTVSRYVTMRRSQKGPTTSMSITADFAKGSSGAPVFDPHGNVCGMVTSTNSIYYNRGAQGVQENLQMVIKNCVPAAAILDLFADDK